MVFMFEKKMAKFKGLKVNSHLLSEVSRCPLCYAADDLRLVGLNFGSQVFK